MTTGEILFYAGIALLVVTVGLIVFFLIKKPKYTPEDDPYFSGDDRTQVLHNGYPTDPLTRRHDMGAAEPQPGTMPLESADVYAAPNGTVPLDGINAPQATTGTVPLEAMDTYGAPNGTIPLDAINVPRATTGTMPLETMNTYGTPNGTIPLDAINAPRAITGTMPLEGNGGSFAPMQPEVRIPTEERSAQPKQDSASQTGSPLSRLLRDLSEDQGQNRS